MPKILKPDGRLARALRTAEAAEILKAISEVSGDIPKAAELLGISRRSHYVRIHALGIEKAANLSGAGSAQ